MRYVAVFLITLCSFTCTRVDESTIDTSIIGNWKLKSYYMSPGGPGQWYDANPLEPSYIEFTSDGKVNYNPESVYGARFYQLLSDSTLNMLRETDTLMYRYKVSGDELSLFPPCIEGCESKYRRVSAK